MKARRCIDCNYVGAAKHSERLHGEIKWHIYDVPVCRRNPPQINPRSTAYDRYPAFPIVDPEKDWCGEFKEKSE